jgi:vacuolar-type H+-ATPase subunit H
LKQSRTIVESRNELISQARHEAENIVRKAAEEAARMVSQEAIYTEAKRQCVEMVEQTKAQIASLRKASNEYMDDALRRTEDAIAEALTEVKDTRAKFQALTAQPAAEE